MHDQNLEPSASIGIVAYNTPINMLRQTISSLRLSTIDLSIFLLCNSPDPNYQSQIGLLAKQFNAVALLNRQNRGFGAGHNEIAELVETTWYICCNPDVSIQKDAVEKLITFGTSKPQSMMLSPQFLYPDGSIQKLARKHLTIRSWLARQIWRALPSIHRPFEDRFDYTCTQTIEFPSGAFFAIRTEKFNQLGGFDNRFFLYCEDADLARRASAIGTNYYVAEARVTHAWTQAWRYSRRALTHQVRSLLRYFLIHGWA